MLCILFVLFSLYEDNGIGVASSKLEADIRSSQKIKMIGRSMEAFLTRWLLIFLTLRI